MDNVKRIKLLEELGFSKIESQVYFILLKKSPLTGYKIAREIGKSNSNTYLALENLVKKGAITLLEGKRSREYIALPIDQYLKIRVIETIKLKETITDAFINFRPPSDDNQIYYLKNKEQLRLKAIDMIQNAMHTILVDSETAQLEMVKGALKTAASRGLKVIVESTGKIRIPKCHMVESHSLNNNKFNLDFSWLVICTDAEKSLVSYFTKDGDLIDGLWISNRLLSDWFYNGMFYEVLHRYTITLFKSNKTKENIFDDIIQFHKNYRYERNHV